MERPVLEGVGDEVKHLYESGPVLRDGRVQIRTGPVPLQEDLSSHVRVVCDPPINERSKKSGDHDTYIGVDE